MIKTIESILKERQWAVITAVLWLMIWGTYNTDVNRFFISGFPRDSLDLIHGLRSLLPFFALFFATVILIRNKTLEFFKFPLGFFFLYAVVGIIASLLSKNILLSFYWGILYISVIIVLFAISSFPNREKNLSLVIWINFFIASFISLFLIAYFFLQPGVFSLHTISQFLEGFRPYEGIGGIVAEKDILGMVGARPTGIGRYAAIAAIFCLALLWNKRNKIHNFYGVLFFLFSIILIFSRARTSVIAFIAALFFMIFLKVKSKFSFIFILGAILILLSFTNFYHYFWWYLVPERTTDINQVETYQGATDINQVEIYQNTGFPDIKINTLSGRTGIWNMAWNLFLISPIIGRGFHADRIFLDGIHAHNTLIQVLIQSGLLGFILFLLAFLISWVCVLYRFRSHPKNTLLVACLGIFVFFTIRSMTESFAFFGADWLFLAPFIIYIQSINSIPSDTKEIILLDKKINILEKKEVLEKIQHWIEGEPHENHWVVMCGMHGVVEGYKDNRFKKIINSADLSLADGASLIFLGRLMGFNLKERIAGPDLMKEYFKFSQEKGHTHFFLGDTKDVLNKLVEKISLDFPNLKIAGIYSPPFREFMQEDNQKMIEIINQKKPDILWVAFNLKKQEQWIFQNRDKLQVSVIIGVGAAFKFLSGRVKRAPQWIGSIGMEWLWRLFYEPKIIWKRVFIYGPIFFWLVLLDLVKRKPEE